MTTPSSASQSAVFADSAGNTATLAVGPTGFSGISVVAASSGPTATIAVASTGAAVMSAVTSSSTAGITADAAVALLTLDLTNFLGVEGTLTVGPQQVTATTNPGTATPVNVVNNLGFVSTVTPDPSAGGSTTFVRQCSNTKSEFYGVGVLRDAQTLEQQRAAARCVVPFSHTLAGTNVVMCHLDVVVLCKCTVAGVGLIPNVGDVFLQTGYSDWVNNNGTITPINLSISSEFAPDYTTNPTWNVIEERGTLGFHAAQYFYQIFSVSGAVAAGTDSLIVSLDLLGLAGGWSFGTTVCEIFVTATYN